MSDTDNTSQADQTAPVNPPDPVAGGSYTRHPQSGELTRVEGPALDDQPSPAQE